MSAARLAPALLALLAAAPAQGEALKLCAPIQAQTVAFSSPKAQDRLSLSLRSADCATKGEMRLELRSAAGALLYEDRWPWENFFDYATEKPRPAKAALSQVLPTVEPMGRYPAAAEIASNPDAVEGDFAVVGPAKLFDRASKGGDPVLCYQTSPTQAICVWFDPRAGRGIKLFSYAG
ncbi:MAG: hypothetical protein MRY74_16335 [Neomegalonema sp.]|nr:hypothetical protein [Neomegalonema sp.]